jgi:hypothetical protein
MACNFGRAHCPNTVKSAWGWKESGGCGNAPVVGDTGVVSGAVRVFVHTRYAYKVAIVVPEAELPKLF